MAFFSIVLVASDNSANTQTVNVNSNWIQNIRAATASEIASFPTAVTAITVRNFEQNAQRNRTFLTAASVASVTASANSVIGAVTSGQATLVAGTLAITIPGITTSNKAFVSLVASNTGSSTVTYQAVCTANTVTLRANVAAGTINVADVSTLNYFVI